jgi:hypothetical protein
MYEIGSILGLTGTLRDRLLCDDRPPLVLGAGYMFIHIGELIRSTYHTHEWSEWEKVKPHYWEHAEFSIRYCKTCLEKEYNLTYLHCPRKKIKGEYCEWCRGWGEAWDKRVVIIDKTCYDDAMNETKRMGRPIDMESLKKALEYRQKGLGILETARVMKKDPTQIVRWYAYIDKKKVTVDKGIDKTH